MEKDKYSDLEAAARAATPGKWQWWTSNSWRRLTAEGGREGGVLCPYNARSDNHPDISVTDEDMTYIEAAQPTAILDLIADLRAAREALGKTRSTLVDCVVFLELPHSEGDNDARSETISEVRAVLGIEATHA